VDEEFPGGPALPGTFSGNRLKFIRLDMPTDTLANAVFLLHAPRYRFVNSRILHYVRQGKSDDIARSHSGFTPPPNTA
jgi:hypothetical protein